MCGISCAVALRGCSKHLSQHSTQLSKQLDESLEVINHRGPDARGQWISSQGRVALGHNRLAIVDLSHEGEQPLHSQDGHVHAVVNGELYGHEQIRETLVSKGYHFQSQCDSEIVIALYQEYGISFLEHLRGEFALCIYDSRAQFFLAVSDRYGIKPLFYTVMDSRLLVASEAKAFLPFGWMPEWDVQSIRDNGWLCDRRTLFDGVQKILPGSYLSCTSFQSISQHRYWDFEFKDKRDIELRTEEAMVQAVRERLLDAVRDRLHADVPVGIFLSGGIDSSAIAGMVKHLMETEGATLGTAPKTDRMNCFSIKFLDENLDEEPIAHRTAEWLGVKKHTIEMTEEVFASSLEDTCWHNEIAMKDLNTVGKFALSKLARDQGIKVVLTGEGSDEHFAGYRELLTDFVRESDPAWPHTALSEEERLRMFNKLEGSEYSGPPEPKTASFARRQVNNVSFIGFTQYASVGDHLFSPWTADEFGTGDKRTIAVNNSLDGRTRDLIANRWHSLHSALYIWTKCALANGLLTGLGDRVELAHSVEGRQPFLDHQLTEYVMGLPPSMKFRWDPASQSFSEKWILKEAVKPFVTEELYQRRKHAFAAPFQYRVDGPVHRLFAGLITKENVENLGFLEWNRCKDLVTGAIIESDRGKFGQMILVGQFVILGKRFGIRKAEPEFGPLTNGALD